ncbi:MAG TPA: efflux RND transporter permease subunit [Myxococcota bacterium]|nr:efflux RND transporter permease subunit [Myxococcota bacterium]
MTLSDVSIRRPVLTWMMMLALTVFGVLGYERLGMDQFPSMDLPVLSVVATLEGADPEGMEEDVTDVLEEQLNTVAGVRSVQSTTFSGATQIRVEFELGTDLDVAAQKVRDKIASVRRDLPKEMDPPTVTNHDFNDEPILWIPFNSTLPPVVASEYVRREIAPVFETIPGVVGVATFGRKDRQIRIWLRGDDLRARGLSANDVVAALGREHVEAPGGFVEGPKMEYGVKTDAEFRTIAELEQLVVSYRDGAPVMLSDVARVEDGAEDERSVHRYNGQNTVGVGIRKQSGGNSVQIVDEVYRRLGAIRNNLPDGITLDGDAKFLDFTTEIREAVQETEFSLVFGALLAVFTVFVFLRRTRPTLIVATAIPISLIASFGLVWLFGYTLNTMTLLGMTLAVGVVIDDAIVVLENIERHREAGEDAFGAARAGTREIAFAASAATFSVAAVFVPVVFVKGIVGSFLGSFGVTVAGSVLISLFVALTLTPMLAARMKPPAPRAHGSIYHRLEQAFALIESTYRRALDWTLAHRGRTIAIALSAFAVALGFGHALPGELFPSADEALFFARSETAPGTSLESTLEYLERDEAWFLGQSEVAGMFSAVGEGGPDRVGMANQGMLFGTLKPRKERKRTVQELLHDAREALGNVPGRQIRIFNPAEMMRGASHAGAMEIELRGNLPLEDLAQWADAMIERLAAHGGFVDLDRSLKLGQPELRVIPDRAKAAALGIDGRTLADAVQIMIGGLKVGVFKEAGRRYDIRARLERVDRSDPEAIERLYVRSRDGNVTELRNVVRTELGAAPSSITRHERQRSVTISANLDDRVIKMQEASRVALAIGAEILPPNVHVALAGNAEQMTESFQQAGIAIGLGVLVIFMVLAAQFESWIHPLTVMLALPMAMTGALGALFLTKNSLNLFSLIGIILLFGLVTKNSILLVDYAQQLRAGGMDKVEAMRTAAPIRMRPVLMTAVAMIFGVLPAAIGVGPGSETRAPMAIATGAGMLSSTVLTLLVVPVFYIAFDDFAEWVKRGFRRAPVAAPRAVPSSAELDDAAGRRRRTA